MRYFQLPGIEKDLSVVCLGTGEYGSRYPEDEAFALLDAFAAHGGTFLDTAHVYADWLPNGSGASERTVGRWLRRRNLAGRFTVGTKGAHPRLETMAISRLRPEDIARDLDESRDRLGLDVIDLYWLHRDDPAIPVGEILSALNVHRAAGKIRAFGASNWSTSRLQEAADYTAAHGLTGFCASQIAWSLAQNNTSFDPAMRTIAMDDEALRFYCGAGLKLIPYTAQAGGFFAHPCDPGAGRFAAYHNPRNARRWERARALAQDRGVSPNAVALAYLLCHPCGGAAIVGAHTPAQIEDSCGAAGLALTPDNLQFLEAD